MTRCAGCGAPLPPNKVPGRPRKWCSERCRKNSYGDPCADCGKRTRFGAERPRVPEPRCHACAVALRKVWTRETVIDAIQTWAERYGEPPAGPDWNPWHARHVLHDEQRARRFEDANGRWPNFRSVYDVFGTWNAATEAAGFEPRAAHGGSGNEQRLRSMRAKAAA